MFELLHWLTWLGFALITIGTLAVYLGTSRSAKETETNLLSKVNILEEQNTSLKEDLKKSKFLIPEQFYVDFNVDIGIEGNKKLEKIATVIDTLIKDTSYDNESSIVYLTALNNDLIQGGNNGLLSTILSPIIQFYEKFELPISFLKGDSGRISIVQKDHYIHFDSFNKSIENGQSGDIFYFPSQNRFSISISKIPYKVQLKDSHFTSLYDFEHTDVHLNLKRNSGQIITRGGIAIGVEKKPYAIEIKDFQSLHISAGGLTFVSLAHIEQTQDFYFVGKIEELSRLN